MDFFSRSLHEEYKGRGIIVQCQAPYFVASKMSRVRSASLATPSPDAWAAAAVAAITSGAPAGSTVPYWPHALQDSLLRALPTSALRAYVMSLHLDLRRRFLKKGEAAAAGSGAGAGAAKGGRPPSSSGEVKKEK